MNYLLKYLGVIVLLIGVGILTVPTVTGSLSNMVLLVGLILIILGYIAHILFYKRFE